MDGDVKKDEREEDDFEQKVGTANEQVGTSEEYMEAPWLVLLDDGLNCNTGPDIRDNGLHKGDTV